MLKPRRPATTAKPNRIQLSRSKAHCCKTWKQARWKGNAGISRLRYLMGGESGEAVEAPKNSIAGEQGIVFADQSTSYVGIDLEMYENGTVSPESLELLRQVNNTIRGNKRN